MLAMHLWNGMEAIWGTKFKGNVIETLRKGAVHISSIEKQS
jgi:hypothetical protein